MRRMQAIGQNKGRRDRCSLTHNTHTFNMSPCAGRDNVAFWISAPASRRSCKNEFGREYRLSPDDGSGPRGPRRRSPRPRFDTGWVGHFVLRVMPCVIPRVGLRVALQVRRMRRLFYPRLLLSSGLHVAGARALFVYTKVTTGRDKTPPPFETGF